MKLTQASRYAIQALATLAVEQPEGLMPSHQIASAQEIPVRFLLKILQSLTRAGLLHSVKGVAGGYRLARPAQRITLLEIVEAVDGPIRGQLSSWRKKGQDTLDQKLQTICVEAADQTRSMLAKVKLAALSTEQ